MKKNKLGIIMLSMILLLLPVNLAFASEPIDITVHYAVDYAIRNNRVLTLLDDQTDLANIQLSNTKENIEDLENAEDKIKKGKADISNGMAKIQQGKGALEAAKAANAQGIALKDITVPGLNIEIKKNTPIEGTLKGKVPPEQLGAIVKSILNGQTEELERKEAELNQKEIALTEAQETFSLSALEFKLKMQQVSKEIDGKIGYNTIVTYDVEDMDKLMTAMAGTNYEVTKYAKEIYKNQIAMLVKKNYYDALYAEKMLEVKTKTKERARQQYNMSKLSYENGMKSKDDYLLAKMYYDGAVIEHQLAEATYKNALMKLKENMNYDLDRDIALIDDLVITYEPKSLKKGIRSGLENRLEIRQDLGNQKICKINENIIDEMSIYDDNALTEAQFLVNKATHKLELDQKKIESEIRQSYELYDTTGDMLASSETLIENAQEVVKIAQLKYDQGLGANNALLTSLNLGASSGTMLEVIAAEEKLADVEATVANLRYQHTMAKVKFRNDCGYLDY